MSEVNIVSYVNIQWLVVGFSVGVVCSICKVESDVEVVYDLQVGLYSDVKSVAFEVVRGSCIV